MLPILIPFILLPFLSFAAATMQWLHSEIKLHRSNQYARTHAHKQGYSTHMSVWDDKQLAGYRTPMHENMHCEHCPISLWVNTTVHTNTHYQWNTNVPVLFKEVQLNVMLNIISHSTFIKLCFLIERQARWALTGTSHTSDGSRKPLLLHSATAASSGNRQLLDCKAFNWAGFNLNQGSNMQQCIDG